MRNNASFSIGSVVNLNRRPRHASNLFSWYHAMPSPTVVLVYLYVGRITTTPSPMPPFARQTLSRRNFPQRSLRRGGGGGSGATTVAVALDVFRARPSPLGHMIACRHCRQPHSRVFFGRNFCYKNGGVQLKSISLSPLSALNRATPAQRGASHLRCSTLWLSVRQSVCVLTFL